MLTLAFFYSLNTTYLLPLQNFACAIHSTYEVFHPLQPANWENASLILKNVQGLSRKEIIILSNSWLVWHLPTEMDIEKVKYKMV